jgi:hypothetical protein
VPNQHVTDLRKIIRRPQGDFCGMRYAYARGQKASHWGFSPTRCMAAHWLAQKAPTTDNARASYRSVNVPAATAPVASQVCSTSWVPLCPPPLHKQAPPPLAPCPRPRRQPRASCGCSRGKRRGRMPSAQSAAQTAPPFPTPCGPAQGSEC